MIRESLFRLRLEATVAAAAAAAETLNGVMDGGRRSVD